MIVLKLKAFLTNLKIYKMKKKYFKLLYGLVALFNFQANAQWLPPINFTNPTSVCDNTPWKLVFYDGFEGTTLNNTK